MTTEGNRTVALDASDDGLPFVRPVLELPAAAAGTVPTEFRLFRRGPNETTKGRFVFDEKAAASVMAAYAEHGIDLMMDYEHQSLVRPPVKAPASAKRFTPDVRGGELWATDVKWTDEAAEHIRKGEYRYFSPAFEFDPKTRRITRLINVALTNLPATRNQQPLVAARHESTETTMAKMKCARCKDDMDSDEDEAFCGKCAGKAKTTMLAALGLQAGASDETAIATLTELTQLRTQLATLTGKTAGADIVGVVAAWQSGAAQVAELQASAARTAEQKLEADFAAAVERGRAERKLSPAQIEKWVPTLKRDSKATTEGLAQLNAFLEVAPPLVPAAGPTAPPAAGAAAVMVTAEDRKVAEMLGISVEDIQKDKQARLAAGK